MGVAAPTPPPGGWSTTRRSRPKGGSLRTTAKRTRSSRSVPGYETPRLPRAVDAAPSAATRKSPSIVAVVPSVVSSTSRTPCPGLAAAESTRVPGTRVTPGSRAIAARSAAVNASPPATA